MKENATGHAHLNDHALWVLESTSLGHHPRAAGRIADAIVDLDLRVARDEAIARVTAVLTEMAPSSSEQRSVAALVVDRIAQDVASASL